MKALFKNTIHILLLFMFYLTAARGITQPVIIRIQSAHLPACKVTVKDTFASILIYNCASADKSTAIFDQTLGAVTWTLDFINSG